MKSQEYKNYKYIVIGLGVLFIISSITFIWTGLAKDVRTYYLGLAKLAQFHDNEFLGVLYNWELKGFISRYILWIPYKIATLFYEYSTLDFIRCYKGVYYIGLIICVLLSSMFFYKRHKNYAVFYFLMVCNMILCSATIFGMQAEMSCIIIMIVSFSMAYFTDDKMSSFLAGGLLSLIFFIKSSFVLLSISVVCGILLLTTNKKGVIKKIYYSAIGGICFSVTIIFLLYFFYPQELVDIFQVPSLYRTVLSGNKPPIISFVRLFLSTGCWGIPSVLISMCITIVSLIVCLKSNKILDVMLMMLIWGMPASTILLSGRTNAYYYSLFLFPAYIMFVYTFEKLVSGKLELSKARKITIPYFIIICISAVGLFLIFNNTKAYTYLNAHLKILRILVAFFGLFSVYVFFRQKKYIKYWVLVLCSFSCVIYMSSISIFSIAGKSTIKLEEAIASNTSEMRIKFAGEDSKDILYLDDGFGPSIICKKSYLRYFFPIPLQRVDLEDPEYYGEYKELLDEVSSYNGKYLFINPKWFYAFYENNAVKKKIEKEYKVCEKINNYYFLSPIFYDINNLGKSEYILYERR